MKNEQLEFGFVKNLYQSRRSVEDQVFQLLQDAVGAEFNQELKRVIQEADGKSLKKILDKCAK